MSGAGLACAGPAYRYGHLAGARHWVLITPDGERLRLCSPECILALICNPAYQEQPPEPIRPPARRRGLLELLERVS